MQFITRPIEKWPRPETRERRYRPYRVDYLRVLEDLQYELEKLGADGTVALQLDFKESEIRRDGTPYADRRPATPRVAIAFKSRHGPLTYYCDRFTDWRQNVRAIGLGLERLRLVEDTGIVTRGEQYTGFKALPPSSIPMGDGMTVEEAAKFVANEGGSAHYWKNILRREKTIYDEMYRAAAKRLHHDAGGDAEDWQTLQRAAAKLDAWFAEAAT